ncbi:hypothetical protein C3F09_01895 [candidate division GN15 bacterium]|uniref:FlgD/Vpr Ig-like domain-containing protein n=1 Tax=candidate division GN15 bacterium TaxID=2072418 RepID=A0A855XCC7_9BACT|nr:MAG: hypothetical protein C3F09_01895 [candidate division GN15 bacterium]
MLKRFWTLTVVSAILVLAVVAAAKTDQKVIIGDAVIGDDNLIRVPVSVTNGNDLVGIDLAFKYSAGVRIKEVTFENTRVSYWDLKATMLNPTNQTIVAMMVPQLTMTKKPALAEGTGPIAELVFERTDPTVKEIKLEPTVVEDPHHSVFFVYANTDASGKYTQWREDPEVLNGTVALVAAGANLPTKFALDQNFPNPFNPTTQVSFALPKNAHVQLTVFNVLGQTVKTLVDEDMAAGNHTVTWNGRNSDGEQVSSGIYFYRISAGDFNATKKMMMLK